MNNQFYPGDWVNLKLYISRYIDKVVSWLCLKKYFSCNVLLRVFDILNVPEVCCTDHHLICVDTIFQNSSVVTILTAVAVQKYLDVSDWCMSCQCQWQHQLMAKIVNAFYVSIFTGTTSFFRLAASSSGIWNRKIQQIKYRIFKDQLSFIRLKIEGFVFAHKCTINRKNPYLCNLWDKLVTILHDMALTVC